jgi:N-acetylglucosamine kinase-like BadF-type ATPase
MAFFLGVDAGGTKTRAVLVDAAGRIAGAGDAGPGNAQAVGVDVAGATVRAAANVALARAGAGADAVRGAFFGLAGVRTPEERAALAAELSGLGLGRAWEIGSDLDAAHAGALAGGPGVVVIAGTGSSALARNAAGQTAQAGGWGWLVDDCGGGYWLALRGLAAACEGEDGRGPATALGARAMAFFAVSGLRELLRELHAGRRDRAAVAAFAREVRTAASVGDPVALRLVRAAADELLRMAVAARLRVGGGEGFPLAVTGGLGLGGELVEGARREGFVPVEPWGEPVLGAVLRAAQSAGVVLDAAARVALLAAWNNRA